MSSGIGRVRSPSFRQAEDTTRAAPGQFGEGVAQALGSLSQNLGSVAPALAAYAKRQEKTENFVVQRDFVRWSNEQRRAQVEELRSAGPGGLGLTNTTNERVEQQNKEFLATVPDRLKPKYEAILAEFGGTQRNTAFAKEIELGDELFKRGIEQTVEEQAGEIAAGNTTFNEAVLNVEETIEGSDLPEVEKEALRVSSTQLLSKADFRHETTVAVAVGLPVRPPVGKDVVLSGLGPQERGALNAISIPESGGNYFIRYNGPKSKGAKFTDVSDHPRVYVATGTGEVSSAAGRYQFTAETWDEVAQELDLGDFSPANQDKAAAHLARKRYNATRSAGELKFDAMLMSGIPENIVAVKRALTPTWAGLGNLSDEDFVKVVQGETGIRGGGTGTPSQPDIWTDPQYASLTYDQKYALFQDAARQEKTRMTTEAKALKLAHTTEFNSAILGVADGTVGEGNEEALRAKGTIKTPTELKQFRAAVEAKRTEVDTRAEVGEKLDSESYVFTATDNLAMNKYVGKAGLAALGEMSDDYLLNGFNPLVNRLGYIPGDSAATLMAMAETGQPAQQQFAFNVLGNFYSIAPEMLERSPGLTNDFLKDVGMYSVMKRLKSPEEMVEFLNLMKDPKFAGQRRELMDEGLKAYRNKDTGVTQSDLTEAFSTGFVPFFREPEAPLTTQQILLLQAEAETLFAEGWLMNQDRDLALEYTTTQLRRHWGVTEVGGEKRLMRNGPARYYNTINGSREWIDFQVREELGMNSDEVFSLVADDQTVLEGNAAKEKNQGTNASYKIARRNSREEGSQWTLMLAADGASPLRIAFDEQATNIVEGQQWIVSYENLQRKIENRGDLLIRAPANKRAPGKLSPEQKVLVDELEVLTNSAEAMRNSRQLTQGDTSLQGRLLRDMENEAQGLYERTQGVEPVTPVAAALFRRTEEYYNNLLETIRQRGGKQPGEVN